MERGNGARSHRFPISSSVPSSSPSSNTGTSMIPVPGPGTITSSSTVVTGHGTAFLSGSNIRRGDALIIARPDKGQEMRIVQMVLSDSSVGISSAFSLDLVEGHKYMTIAAPKDVRLEKMERSEKMKKDAEEIRRNAFGTYASGNDAFFGEGGEGAAEGRHQKTTMTEFVYRVNDGHGSYKIKREKLEGRVTREDLVEMRQKKKSDKYC